MGKHLTTREDIEAAITWRLSPVHGDRRDQWTWQCAMKARQAQIRGYFNTWAMYGLMLSDHAIFGKKLPEMRTDQMPVVRRFYSQEPAQHTKYEEQFYDMLGEAQRLRGTMRTLDTMGRSDIADRKEQSPMAGEAKPLERAQKNLAGIIKDMAAVRKDDNLTPAEKREKLDALTAERNALLKATVKDAKGAKP